MDVQTMPDVTFFYLDKNSSICERAHIITWGIKIVIVIIIISALMLFITVC